MKGDSTPLKPTPLSNTKPGNLMPTMLPLLPGSAVGASRGLPRLMAGLIVLASLTYFFYSFRLLSPHPHGCSYPTANGHATTAGNRARSAFAATMIRPIKSFIINASGAATGGEDGADASPPSSTDRELSSEVGPTTLRHVVFGIAASASLWDKRKEYIKLWWRPGEMRGAVWLDKQPDTNSSSSSSSRSSDDDATLLPPIRISADTSSFAYTHKTGHRSAIRISRIVSETIRLPALAPPDARWFVMGDDDTFFVPDNLVAALSRLDHRQPYYVGAGSESHLQNIFFSYNMAYGGGGFALSRPLAESLSRMQDRCIQRYPGLYGSDDRMQACMAELGVPITRHPGFHQCDLYGDLYGLLAAHPVAPLVSLHHLDVVEPLFPGEDRAAALRRLLDGPGRLDPPALVQQSICYDGTRKWTVSASWGFAVQIIRGVVSPREIEMPTRTFLNWHRRMDYTMFAFNTRAVAKNPCHRPFVYYLRSARLDQQRNLTVTRYGPRTILGGGGKGSTAPCRWKGVEPTVIDEVIVYKLQDPYLWDRAPRRNCCRVMKDSKGEGGEGNNTMRIDVGVCRDGEVTEML